MITNDYMTPPLLTQAVGSNVPRLESQFQGNPYLPQSGELPPVSCPPPCVPEETSEPSWFWLAIIAGGLVLLTARKRQPKAGESSYGFS